MSYVFNITSDLLMLMVPIPMLLTSQLPWKQCVAFPWPVPLTRSPDGAETWARPFPLRR